MKKHIALRKTGFATVPVLIGLVVVGMIATAAALRFIPHGSSKAPLATISNDQMTKETALRADLSRLRNAAYQFMTDTNAWPQSLADLTAASPGHLMTPGKALDGEGKLTAVPAKGYHGPYLQSIPSDPVSGSAFVYSVEPGSVGTIHSSASGVGSDAIAYAQW